VALAANIYKPDFDGGYLLEKIENFNLKKELRIGFANPISSFDMSPLNEYLELGSYSVVVPAIMELLRRCELDRVRLKFDCVVPLCTFTKEEYGEFVINNMRAPRAVCEPVIDISPDLRVSRCFATAGMFNERLITEFGDYSEIVNYFDRRLGKFQRIGGMDKCFTCEYMEKGRCQGGCIGFTINRFRTRKQTVMS
jgi:hypothetical protein